MNNLWIWLAIIIISIIAELITVGLTSIWMAGGALVALICAAVNAPLWLQTVVFFAVTFLLIYFTRPLAVKYLNKKRIRTNVDAMIGIEVKVLERVDNTEDTGKALAKGMEWSAKSADSGVIFEVGDTAKVLKVSGVKLILEK